MLTGERPFRGDRRLLLDASAGGRSAAAAPPQRPDIPRDLEIDLPQGDQPKRPAAAIKPPARWKPTSAAFRKGEHPLARPMGSIERTSPLVPPLSARGQRPVRGHLRLRRRPLVSVEPVGVVRPQTALESARLENKMLDEVWRFYSEEIEDINSKTTGVQITQDYRKVHPALPLPATFSIDLGERISRRNPGMQVRVFSRYPWPGREKGGRRTKWSGPHRLARGPTCQIHKQQEFAQFVEAGGKRQLHYFAARHMEKSCLGCHNDISSDQQKPQAGLEGRRRRRRPQNRPSAGP